MHGCLFQGHSSSLSFWYQLLCTRKSHLSPNKCHSRLHCIAGSNKLFPENAALKAIQLALIGIHDCKVTYASCDRTNFEPKSAPGVSWIFFFEYSSCKAYTSRRVKIWNDFFDGSTPRHACCKFLSRNYDLFKHKCHGLAQTSTIWSDYELRTIERALWLRSRYVYSYTPQRLTSMQSWYNLMSDHHLV